MSCLTSRFLISGVEIVLGGAPLEKDAKRVLYHLSQISKIARLLVKLAKITFDLS